MYVLRLKKTQALYGDDEGATAVEYAIVASLIGAFVAATVALIGPILVAMIEPAIAVLGG